MNKNRKYRRAAMILSIVMAVMAVFSLPAVHTVEAASLKDLQATLNSLKQQQAALDSKLASLKDQAESQEAYLASLKEKITNAQSQIDNLNNQIDAYDAQISDRQAQISDSEAQISTDYTTLKKRLKLMYMMGESSLLDIVFSADNVVDYFNKAEFVSSIVKHDNSIIETLKAKTEEIKQEKADIEADRAALASVKNEYDAQKTQLEAAAAESARVAAQIQAAAVDAEAQKILLQKKHAEADKAIEAWWVAYYKQQEELKNQQTTAIVSTGTFMWPMPGYASKSNLGDLFGAGRGHRGIDIKAANIAGKPFVAADSGRVVYVSYNDPIYGIYCMIDHGNGVSTLYGHCSGLTVKAGQNVTKGQTLGYVGMSGVATGYHLHFGVLKNGVAIDPMQFFNIG